MAGLPPFQKFDVFNEETSLGIRWTKYVSKLENMFTGLAIDSKKRKKALLLHYAGDDVFDIYETLNLDGNDSNYDETKKGLGDYFNPKKNKEFERYEFRNMKQSKSESIDQFVTRLRQKATNCDFTDKDVEIKSQMIQGCYSQKLRTKCLEEDKALDVLLTMARTMEIAQKQAKCMENGQSDSSLDKVDKIKSKSSKQFGNSSPPKRFVAPAQQKHTAPRNPTHKPRDQKCRNCGGEFPHRSRCPAIGVECHYCHKKNHFISVCQKRIKNSQRQRLREIAEDASVESDTELKTQNDINSDSDQEVTYGLKSHQVSHINSKVPCMTLKINDVDTKVLIDTGSSLNLVDEHVVQKMNPRPKLQKSKVRAFAFGQCKPLPIKGKYTCTVETDSKITTADFHVVSGNKENIISYQTAVQLQIIPSICAVSQNDYELLCNKYNKVFQGLGKLKDREIKFHVDESIVPVAQSPRRIPFHLRDQVAKELDRLEKMDVIEKVEGPTPWVSNLVVAPKPNNPNDIRLCVDMRKANEAIKRERHVTPTIDDIILELNGSTVFSKVDLNKGFHQLVLSEQSRSMTTFATHVGLRRYKRLNFGVSCAPEIFQNEIRQALEGLNGTLNISDDIIVHGKTREEHDQNLEALLNRLQEKNLTLNKNKCEFGKPRIKFYGFIFSESGISPDPQKIEAIKNVEQPKTAAEVRSFLGMTNYVSRFINNYSSITEPLRRLTKQENTFTWTDEQEQAFIRLKDSLVSDQVMTYFNPSLPSELWVDASPVGVSGILIQQGKIVSYGSRALSPTEQRYSQTEREALACVFGCEHYFLYLFGKEFTLITDHKPLESIFNNVKKIHNARLERFRLRLNTYNFKVKYRKASEMISDYCSRHPYQPCTQTNIAEDYVKCMARVAQPGALTLSDIAKATNDDVILKSVMDAVQQNSWEKQTCRNNDTFQCYKSLSQELSVVSVETGTILLRGTKLCIPETLQKHVVELAHEGHQGQVKCKALLRETLWFPYMDKLVSEICRDCIPCQAFLNRSTPDPIKPTELPKEPFSDISVDFCGPFTSGHYFMVIIDDYSRFPVVEKLSNLTAKTVIARLEKFMGIWGIPTTCRTDNGPPWNSDAMSEFAAHMGFIHRKSIPYHPMGNSQAESFMKPLQKAIKTAVAAGLNYEAEIQKFLINFRNTPTRALGLSPSEIVFKRKLKTKLPKFSVQPKDKYLRQRDMKYKLKNKQYADQKRGAKPCLLKYGDYVLLKRQSQNKEETAFYPTPAKVIRRKGCMITVRFRDKYVTRDASKFKYIRNPGNMTNQPRRQHHGETTSSQSGRRESVQPSKAPEL